MSFSTLTRRNAYQGDGVTKVFPYSFKIFNANYLRVVRRSILGVETILTVGTDYTVTGVGLSAGGSITLTTALQVNEALAILGAQPLSQDLSIRNQDAYYPATIEDGADQSRMIDQQLDERVGRALHVPPTTVGFTTRLAPLSTADKLKVIRINSTSTAFEVVDLLTAVGDAGGGATGKLKAPTDGVYGGVSGNPANLQIGDIYEDAFDKLATLFGKLTPSPPANLSAKTLTVVGAYQAKGAADGAVHAFVTDNTAPVITPGLTSNIASGFADPDAGNLSATLDGAASGLILLTTGDDTGLTNGLLSIVAEFDPYLGQGFGKEGIFKAITAKIQASGLAVGVHMATMVHSTTGTASLTFYIDDPAIPAITANTMTPSGATASKSGVPYYATGATLTVGFTITGAIKSHYNATRVASVSAPQTTTTVNTSPASAPGVNASYSDSAALTVAAGQYTENVTATITGYNSKGGTGTGSASAQVRVDTIGTETRVQSATGQFPASGYGAAYDSTQSLALNKELQFIAGGFRYPPAVTYAASKPAGPDYSALTADSYASMRWVTFNFGSVSNASSVTFTLQSASGFTSTLQSGAVIYLKVDGASGWIDATAAYSGPGSPSADGTGALDIGNSSPTVKRVTFGGTVRSGTVYVRIGIPSGSTKLFGGIA